MTRILAIDPGPVESAYVVIDSLDCRPEPSAFGKVQNREVLEYLSYGTPHVAIEMVASYGMAVGAEVFETCVWIGRFQQVALDANPNSGTVERIYRRDVKLHHCGDSRAKDSNVTQALIDRFAYGQPNRGKGTKANPGWFHGFAKDIWQAYALAVLAADRLEGRAPLTTGTRP